MPSRSQLWHEQNPLSLAPGFHSWSNGSTQMFVMFDFLLFDGFWKVETNLAPNPSAKHSEEVSHKNLSYTLESTSGWPLHSKLLGIVAECKHLKCIYWDTLSGTRCQNFKLDSQGSSSKDHGWAIGFALDVQLHEGRTARIILIHDLLWYIHTSIHPYIHIGMLMLFLDDLHAKTECFKPSCHVGFLTHLH